MTSDWKEIEQGDRDNHFLAAVFVRVVDPAMIDRTVIWQAALHVIPASIAPVFAVFSASTSSITSRSVAVMSLSALVGGAAALKAFLSTTYAEKKTPPMIDKPPPVKHARKK